MYRLTNTSSWAVLYKMANRQIIFFVILVVLGAINVVSAATLNNIEYTVISAQRAEIMLTLSAPASEQPYSFTIDNPARLAIDLPGTGINLDKKNIAVDSELIRNIRVAEANGRTRMVVSLLKMVPYDIRTENNQIFISLSGQGGLPSTRGTVNVASGNAVSGKANGEIKNIDFKRNADGGGVITVTLSSENTTVNLAEKGDKIIADFFNQSLPEKLRRRLDVSDFATPVKFVDFYATPSGSRMAISATGMYTHLAYQANNQYTIEVQPPTKEEEDAAKRNELGYTGEKLSLNFQNIEVRAVLQLIADFTGLNIIASDSVRGTITLRLKNVPWDQALDIILKSQGLGMRKAGNVVLIAPNSELATREKEEMQANKQRVDLAPLHTEFYTVSYAKASEIASILKAKENSILSTRGSVTVDTRTNTLMVLETGEKHEEVAKLIKQLDVPIRQVMIESRIVIANDDFSRDLGVRTGVSGYDIGSQITTVAGSHTGANNLGASITDSINNGTVIEYPSPSERYNFNLPAGGSSGAIGVSILGSGYLVDLELSALQTEGRGEVVSNPRVVTSNQKEAKIEQGVDIPYQEASSSGATSTSFKKAVLSLQVTPQITPDERVVMDLKVNKDSVGGIYGGVPSINTRSVQTQVLVNNGDTVVLGGIYETSSTEGETKVPLLGDIPILGYLFRSKSNKESKSELLIFVTPKILNDALEVGM